MAYKLSIVVPCYNRGQIIQDTLPYLREQVMRHTQEVELIVCNNASTDDTLQRLERMREVDPFFSIYNFDTHEPEVGRSISRSASQGTGEYVLLWGDDDIPFPFMVDTYLKALKDYPDVGCVTANRLLGYPRDDQVWPIFPVENLRSIGTVFSDYYQYYSSASEFIVEHAAQEMGFVGVNVFLRSVWNAGMAYYTEAAYGFEFLTPILAGMAGRAGLYISSPVCIQRTFYHSRYRDRWPLYLHLGMPNMFRAVQKAGVLQDWRAAYDNYRFVKSTRSVFVRVFEICLKNRAMYLPFVDELQQLQATRMRKIAFGIIRLPSGLIWLLQLGWRCHVRIVEPLLKPLWTTFCVTWRLLLAPLRLFRRIYGKMI